MFDQRLSRVRHFLDAARVLRDPGHPLGREARETLPAATGLSQQNVDWALENALEIGARDEDLALLCTRAPLCQRAHVLLSANVFVGALRAIAIGLASAPTVCVRPSRRESQMVALLSQAAAGQFQRVETIQPAAGEHCWVYGTDATIADLRITWPEGVVIHGHGHGYGVVVLEAKDLQNASDLSSVANALAVDVAAFDQRGCLSPRVILVEKSSADARRLSQALADALMRREKQIPMGTVSHDERADVRRHHDTMCVVGQAIAAGSGLVTLETQPLPWILPPIGRVLHVRTVRDAIQDLEPRTAEMTTIAVKASNPTLGSRLAQAFPHARITQVGRMQVPALDGPVDLRDVANPVS